MLLGSLVQGSSLSASILALNVSPSPTHNRRGPLVFGGDFKFGKGSPHLSSGPSLSGPCRLQDYCSSCWLSPPLGARLTNKVCLWLQRGHARDCGGCKENFFVWIRRLEEMCEPRLSTKSTCFLPRAQGCHPASTRERKSLCFSCTEHRAFLSVCSANRFCLIVDH